MSFSPQKSGAEIIDRIVAQVGDKIITLHDIETFAPGSVRSINSIPNKEERDALWNKYYNDTLSLMIQDIIVQTSAARMGQVVTEQQIDDVLVRMQDQNSLFRAKVREVMDREGKITPELRMEAKNELLRQKVQAILLPRVVVTEQDIRDYLKNDPEIKFGQTEYNIDLAFLPDNASYAVFLETLKKGTFEEAVAAASERIIPMGWQTLNDLAPEMGNAVKQLSIGDVSNAIVDENNRYAVLKLVNTRTESNISDSLRESITNKIQMQQIDGIFKNWIERNSKSILVNRYDQ